jgi:hypothetical protein
MFFTPFSCFHKCEANLAMVKEILKSTWPACTDPGNSPEGPFTTDLIISNPPTNGHIHVAEALGVPLHIMFPQPWYYGKYDSSIASLRRK